MKNREFYKEEILGFMVKSVFYCEEFIKPKILRRYGIKCNETTCSYCRALQQIWLEEEYKEIAESPVDWSKIEVDTPILVSNDGRNWSQRHFAKFKEGNVYTWANGGTSWSAKDSYFWTYAKLAERE